MSAERKLLSALRALVAWHEGRPGRRVGDGWLALSADVERKVIEAYEAAGAVEIFKRSAAHK